MALWILAAALVVLAGAVAAALADRLEAEREREATAAAPLAPGGGESTER